MALRLNKIEKPNVILNLSNSPIHEIESRSVILMKTMEEATHQENITRIWAIVYRIHMTITYMRDLTTVNRPVDELQSVETTMEKYTLLEYQVRNKISFLEERGRTIADEMVEFIMIRLSKEYLLLILLQLREFMRISGRLLVLRTSR